MHIASRNFLAIAFFTSFIPAALADPTVLNVVEESITVNGKESKVFAIRQDDGTAGLTVDKSEGFHVLVRNQLLVPTSIHWHGIVLPNLEDGVPWVTQEPIPPGGEREYQFPLVQAGTYWMHSHYGLQEQVFCSAPLIILDEAQRAKADQDVVIFLSDYTTQPPIEILDSLKGKSKPTKTMDGKMKMPAASDSSGSAMKMPNKRIPAVVQKWDSEAKRLTFETRSIPKPDIDVKYDALTANRRALSDPDIVAVAPGESVLLRIIAGSSATNFFIHTGELDAELLAVDGQDCEPVRGNFFQIAIAQRLDLRVEIPDVGGAFPILALGEGTTLQTGVILATKDAKLPKLADTADALAGALDNTQELLLESVDPLPKRAIDRSLPSVLAGSMSPYVWTINGQAYPNRKSLDVKEGERVELVLTNESWMSHPMHLHGHDFQVTEIDGKRVNGAIRDTVLVPAGTTTKIQFDADNPGIWAYHCHIIYHLAAGMFTVVKYDNADTQFWQPEKSSGELLESLP